VHVAMLLQVPKSYSASNLEGDYGTPAVVPVARAMHTRSFLGATGGCTTLAPHLYKTTYP
jgi:hypothetical protein